MILLVGMGGIGLYGNFVVGLSGSDLEPGVLVNASMLGLGELYVME